MKILTQNEGRGHSRTKRVKREARQERGKGGRILGNNASSSSIGIRGWGKRGKKGEREMGLFAPIRIREERD